VVANLIFAVAYDAVDQPEELSLIVDYKMSNFPCFPSKDRVSFDRGAGTWFIQGIRTFAGSF
jgi:hypothetical protein